MIIFFVTHVYTVFPIHSGLDLCVALMKIGEKAELIIGAKYAYGDTGR